MRNKITGGWQQSSTWSTMPHMLLIAKLDADE